MDQQLQMLLYSKGVFRHYKGYDYFVRAVHLAMEKPERLQHIYKEIYLTVAVEFGTDVRTVEKDLRTVRNVFVKNGGTALLTEMCGASFIGEEHPRLKEMIEIFAFYLQTTESAKKKIEV